MLSKAIDLPNLNKIPSVDNGTGIPFGTDSTNCIFVKNDKNVVGFSALFLTKSYVYHYSIFCVTCEDMTQAISCGHKRAEMTLLMSTEGV